MADRIQDWANKAFQEIHADNPLNKLKDMDRKILWSLLVMYAHAARQRRKGDVVLDELDRVSKTAADGVAMGAKLESQMLEGPFPKALRACTSGFEDLPIRFVQFSEQVEKLVDSMGKRGHKRQIFAGQFLIEASEFVRLKTGQHYDEHLAELFQAIGTRSINEDLSGDAIRKKREYFDKWYPRLYKSVLKRTMTHLTN